MVHCACYVRAHILTTLIGVLLQILYYVIVLRHNLKLYVRQTSFYWMSECVSINIKTFKRQLEGSPCKSFDQHFTETHILLNFLYKTHFKHVYMQ